MSNQGLREPSWPAFVAILAAAIVDLALPETVSFGPSWLALAMIVPLLISIAISARPGGSYVVTQVLTFVANVIITVVMIGSLIFLVQGIPQHREPPKILLRSAGALWIANILIFALWYWKLDAGGPRQREQPGGMSKSSFLFPQLTGEQNKNSLWVPNFVDYLFISFNTCTAFSPTDTAVLSQVAKLATMLQALISLAIVALIAARAVNVL
jgi:hypothetical protein